MPKTEQIKGLNKDFRDLFDVLKRHGVRYLLVGGYAVAYHDKPRYTKDIDIWLDATEENAEAFVGALNEFGMGSLGLKPEDFSSDSKQIFQFGFEPNRIDILLSLPGLDFDESYQARSHKKYGDVEVDVISIEDLIKNKEIVGRPRDKEDVRGLKKRLEFQQTQSDIE